MWVGFSPRNWTMNSPKSVSTDRIPAASRVYFQQILTLYGISRASLFPDLENLALELASMKYVPVDKGEATG